MGLLDYVHKSVQVAKDVAAAATLIANAAPAMKSAMADVEKAAVLLRGEPGPIGGHQYPAEVLHAAGVLGLSLPATLDEVDAAYKSAAKRAHPDAKTGDTAAMVRVNRAKGTMHRYLRHVSTQSR